MSFNYLFLCRSLLLLSSIFPSTRVFSNASTLRIRWPKFESSPTLQFKGIKSLVLRLFFFYNKARHGIKKQRHYFADKVPYCQSYSFSSSHVWIWELNHKEGWGSTKEFLLSNRWCWRRHLSVPWTARRPNQSIIKQINTKYSLGGLMLKLKLQCFGHLMRRVSLLEKTLMVVKIEDRGRMGWQRMRWLDGITDSMDMS